MARLRGHHLICLFFFEGGLGNKAFGLKRQHIVAGIEAGESVEVVAGADDLCASCPRLTGDRCAYKDGAEEEIRKLDTMALGYLNLLPGSSVLWREIAECVVNATGSWFSLFCEGCDWVSTCRQGRW
jgi:hypothetical protein